MQVPGDACGSVIAGVGSSLGVIGSIHRHVTVTERACVRVFLSRHLCRGHSPSVRPLCVGPEHLTVGHVHGGAVRAQPDDARGVGVGAAWLGVTCGARTRQGAVGHSRGQHSWALGTVHTCPCGLQA